MLFTWIKNGKPDVGMCLNAPLAGLVGITAGCASLDALGSAVVGLVTGILVVLIVEVVDTRLHIDDPVGAVGVHCANGIWGTIADGLFNTGSGLFYGGGFAHLGVQLLGVVSIALYTSVVMTIVFQVIKATVGLRASAEEEIMGLDITLTSGYSCQSGCSSPLSQLQFCLSSLCPHPSVSLSLPFLHHLLAPLSGACGL